MISYSNNRGVQILFEYSQRINRILCIPYRRSSHPEDFGTLVNRTLIVFTHYSIVCVVFTRVVALVEYQQRHLGSKYIFVGKHLAKITNLVDGPMGMGNDIEK